MACHHANFAHLSALSNEIYIEAFQYLSVADLDSLQLVSHYYNNLIEEDDNNHEHPIFPQRTRSVVITVGATSICASLTHDNTAIPGPAPVLLWDNRMADMGECCHMQFTYQQFANNARAIFNGKIYRKISIQLYAEPNKAFWTALRTHFMPIQGSVRQLEIGFRADPSQATLNGIATSLPFIKHLNATHNTTIINYRALVERVQIFTYSYLLDEFRREIHSMEEFVQFALNPRRTCIGGFYLNIAVLTEADFHRCIRPLVERIRERFSRITQRDAVAEPFAEIAYLYGGVRQERRHEEYFADDWSPWLETPSARNVTTSALPFVVDPFLIRYYNCVRDGEWNVHCLENTALKKTLVVAIKTHRSPMGRWAILVKVIDNEQP